MKFRIMNAILTLVMLLSMNTVQAYNVWLGTHKWEHSAAENLDQWDMAIDKIEGINYVLLDARADYPAGDGATPAEWRSMIARIDQTLPGMAEISRSQYEPASARTLASRMDNEFATAQSYGYEIDIIMLYDELKDGTVWKFDSQDAQDVRDWLDNNGHADVTMVFRLTNNDQERLALAQNALFDGGALIEASATRWVENNFNVHTLLQDLWTDPKTRDRDIYFQIPRSESSYTQYEETRRALKTIKELMGDEFMRSDQPRFLVCNYGDTFDTYPETANNDTLYVNTKSGVALSLIEQKAIFEGRVGVVDLAFCLSYDRYEVSTDPTSGLVAHWPLDEGSGTATANTAGSSYIATLENGATWGSDATRDSYVSFDGTDDRIATTFTYALANTDDFTWAWWAKQLDTETGSIMVGSRYGNSGSETYEFIKFTPTSVQFANTSNTAEIEKYDYADIPQNEWHHYAMVKQGTTYQWYVDGVAQGSSQTINYSETTPIPFRIGGDIDGKPIECFNGFIDDVVLYRQALTQQEVENVKNGIYLPIVTLTTLGTPVDQATATAWSDGQVPHSGAAYVIPGTGNVKGESGTTTFPGNSLTVQAGGKYQVRSLASSGQIATVDNLILEGGTSGNDVLLSAGTGTDETNVLDGNLTNSGNSQLLTYGAGNRNLDILSRISGTGILQASGGATITIDDAANTFAGTWEVNTGTTLRFNSGEAVGPADISVLSGGTLEILGNLESAATLTVADTAGTTVDVGSYTWVVSALTFGGSPVSGGIYQTSDLNALGGNTVFTGTGSLIVGEAPALIAGWETWADGNSAASMLANGINASSDNAAFVLSLWAACTDGTFGTLLSPAASTANSASTDGLRQTGATDTSIDFTVVNNSAQSVDLATFYFDSVLKTDNTGPSIWTLDVVSGSITLGQVTSGSLQYIASGSDLADYEVSLMQLADKTLNPGQSAVFRLSFTGGTVGNASKLDVDNVALTGIFHDAPVINTPSVADDQSVSAAEDSSVAITLTGSDVDNDPLNFVIESTPANGTLTGTAPSVTYTPAPNYNGADSFTFTVNDSEVATVSITVTAVNDPSVANNQSKSVNEDGSVAITLTGSDIDGDALNFAIASQSVNGTLSGTAPNVTYTPAANFNGSDSFTFTVNDSAAATVSITVNPVNDAPIANSDAVEVDENSSVAITLTGSDPVEGSALTYSVVAQPANGTLSGAAPDLTYTPDADYFGSDSFTFTVNDGTDDSAVATVAITVNEVVVPVDEYVDNEDTRLTYVGNWSIQDDPADYGGSMTWSKKAGNYVEHTFEGTFVQVGVRFGGSGGICNVYIDGVLAAENIDTYAAIATNQVVIYEALLTEGTHTVRLEGTGLKNADSKSANIMFDFFYIASFVAEKIEDDSPMLNYTGTWITQTGTTDSGGSMTWSSTPGDTVSYTFTGDRAVVVVRYGAFGGLCDVKLDGVVVASNIDTYTDPAVSEVVIYDSGVLGYTAHTVELVAAGSGNVMLDYFYIER